MIPRDSIKRKREQGRCPKSDSDGVFTDDSFVAATGDIIDGNRLVSVNSPVINNRGDVVFSGILSDDVDGPTSGNILARRLPEPASVSLPVSALLAMMAYAWRRRR